MKKIKWVETAIPLTLSAIAEVMPRGYETGISDKDMQPIADWLNETKCGKRTSFDTVKFRNKTEMSMFLLRWNNHETSITNRDLF